MTIDRVRLEGLLAKEEERFAAAHPRSRELFERAKKSLLGGVPMNWMVRWAGSFPIFVREASGAHFTDVDGHRYLDLCLGDTGAMTGHAPAASVEAVAAQARRGITFMLPTEDAIWVGEELARRFGLPYWQTTLTATDANRFAIRLARHVTERPKILVFNWCYHGTVDETFITLKDGVAGPRSGNLGPPVDPTETTRVVEFNDVPGARGGARARRRRLRARRAGDDQHRHRASRARLSRRAARDHAPHGNAPHHRRDPHDLRRPGRLHAGPRPARRTS